jgi:RecA/RadA recombinase
MSFIKDMIKATGNEYAALASDGIEINDIENYIDTGCYALNAILSGSIYGGIADNKITALAGDSGVGKSMVSLGIVKSFLDKNKDGICMYFESEAAITSDMIKNFGIDTKRIAVVGVATVEEFRNQVIKIADEYLKVEKESRKPMLLVLDSLGMLSTSKEMADTAEGKDTTDMTRARVIKSIFRVLTLKLGKARIPLLLTNHTYNTLSLYATKVQSGGSGLQYAASTVLFLSKRKEKVDDEIIGNVIHFTLNKGRLTKENSKIDTLLRYDTGLNKYYGLLPIAEKYGIFKKVSTRYEMPDGSKAFEKNINEEPEKYYTPEVMKQLEIAVAKEFKYGNAIENEVSDKVSNKKST